MTATETGFGPAVAVGVTHEELIAAAPDGTVARRPIVGGDWVPLEEQSIATVRAIDGGLIGTDSGVYRVHDGGLDHVGLTDVRDVAAASVPLAATDEGLFKLGNGWMDCLEEPMTAVAADPVTEPGQLSRAHAVAADGTLTAFIGNEWVEVAAPTDESVVALEYGETVYAVTEQGTFCALAGDTRADEREKIDEREGVDTHERTDLEWRCRSLGVHDVSALAISALE